MKDLLWCISLLLISWSAGQAQTLNMPALLQVKQEVLTDSLQVESFRERLERRSAPSFGHQLQAFISATGDLKTAITAKDNSAATGSLQLSFNNSWFKGKQKKGYSLVGTVSYAAVDDTVGSGHSSTLLTPRIGKNSAQFEFIPSWSIREYNKGGTQGFFKLYAFISTISWASPFESDGVQRSDGSILGFGFCPGMMLFKRHDDTRHNRAALEVHGGFMARVILGDLRSADAFRTELLGTDQTFFGGFEAGISVSYKGFTVGLDSYFVFGQGDIPGLGNGQVSGGISVAVDLFEVK
ncbi:MAG: hypothetical protein KTR24_04385 [Saprospiraceae bacterium]|nr:hypothetical protein [Saprospiraceae bacterium]